MEHLHCQQTRVKMVSNTQNIRAAKKTENAVSMIFIINRQSIRTFSTKSSSKTQTLLSSDNTLIARILFVTSSTKHNHIVTETDSLKAIEELMYETLQKLMIMFQKTEKSEKKTNLHQDHYHSYYRRRIQRDKYENQEDT